MKTTYNRYAQKNKDGIIIQFFSDAFEAADENSILIEESENRHYHRNDLFDENDFYKWKEGGNNITERTDTDKIEDYRALKIKQINQKCAYDMMAGYDYNGNIISTSLYAQANWNNLINRINAGKEISYPYKISLVNESYIKIADEAELLTLFDKASQALETIHDNAQVARQEILNSGDVDFIKNYKL